MEVSKALLSRRPSLNVVEHGQLRGCFIFDNTIGGALPILSTLRSLLRTGDRLRFFECCLSGSMNWLSTELAMGVKLSEAVKNAMEQRFTESDPLEVHTNMKFMMLIHCPKDVLSPGSIRI